MTYSSLNRVARGTREGGQFTTEQRSEPKVTLHPCAAPASAPSERDALGEPASTPSERDELRDSRTGSPSVLDALGAVVGKVSSDLTSVAADTARRPSRRWSPLRGVHRFLFGPDDNPRED